jgi:DNA sulfur modification protein DndC
MSLILEEEIEEIQRIWRVEQGDWENSVYAIYEEITGVNLSLKQEDLARFTKVEQEILDGICEKNNVPKLLVSKLLNAEFDSQGMTRHSKIYPKLGKILSEEWRTWDEIETIKDELKDKRKKKLQNEPFSRETK